MAPPRKRVSLPDINFPNDEKLARISTYVKFLERELHNVQRMLDLGAQGQVLTKQSARTYDAKWADAGGGGGGSASGNNLGDGEGEVYKTTLSNVLQFRTLKEGANITITQDGTEVTITATSSIGVNWNDIQGKPSTFPPSAHTHVATAVSFNNSGTGLSATNVQTAIVELKTLIDGGGGGYTDEQAQDAVGNILQSTTTVTLTYDDGTPSITADVNESALLIDWSQLDNVPQFLDDLASIGDPDAPGLLLWDDGTGLPIWIGIGTGLQINGGDLEATGGGGGGATFSGARVKLGSNQNAGSGAFTAVSFTAEIYDTDGFWASGDPTKLVAPANGYYEVKAQIRWDNNTTGTRGLWFRKNGSGNRIAGVYAAAAINNLEQATDTMIFLNAGDYLEVLAYQDSGSTRVLTPFEDDCIASMTAVANASMPGVSFVGEAAVTGSAATSLSISGLDLDSDETYVIVAEVKNATGSNSDVSMYFNSDTTATNYDTQLVLCLGGTVFSARNNDARVMGLDASTSGSADITVTRQIGGKVRALVKGMRNDGTSLVMHDSAMQWRTTATNVTGITLTAGVSNGLAVGSYIRVWKRTS